MRRAQAPQGVHVERQQAGSGAWTQVAVTVRPRQGTLIDALGGFLRLAPCG